jgi:hypothetical protein
MVRNHFPKFLVVTVLLTAWAAPVLAQDTTMAQPKPQRHVVQVGETLWGLAQLYLGDPFLWPEIYRLNTAVVEDPHWIFPGEELLLAPADHTQVAVVSDSVPQPVVTPQPVTPPPTAAEPPTTPVVRDTVAMQQEAARRPVEMVELPTAAPAAPPPSLTTPTIFAREGVTNQAVGLISGPRDRYRGVQPGDFYGATFLTEGRDLPWGQVESIADIGTPRRAAGATAMIYQEIRITAPTGALYQVGDSLLALRVGRDVGHGWGHVVTPTALLRVVSASGPDAVARIVEQFDQVRSGQYVLPAEPFPGRPTGRPQPVSGGVEGMVITRADEGPVPNLYDEVFVDLGRNVSIVPGDLFEILPADVGPASGASGTQVLGEAEVLRVSDRSCTLSIRRIFTTGIRAAARNGASVPVRLVAKMPA